jgi:hypothetical protein
MLQNRRHHPLPPSGVAPAWELVSASYLVSANRLRRFELRAVPKHGMRDNGEPPGERDPSLSQACVYRKLKPGRNDGEARRGSGVNE